MNDFDHRFFRAIAVGAVLGVVGLWAVLTVTFNVLTDQAVLDVAGLSLVPAVFCGPFFGGLFTTSAVHQDDHPEATEFVPREATDTAKAA